MQGEEGRGESKALMSSDLFNLMCAIALFAGMTALRGSSSIALE